MKKFQFISILLLALVMLACNTNNPTLENYHPMVAEGYQWNIETSYFSDPLNAYSIKTYERFMGTTEANGQIYHRLMSREDYDNSSWTLLALLREDIKHQQIYILLNGQEHLLYDFGMEVGEVCRLYINPQYENEPYQLRLEAITKIRDHQGNILRKFQYEFEGSEDGTFDGAKYIVYERIGTTDGVTEHLYGITGDMTRSVQTVLDEKGNIVIADYSIK